MAISRTLHLLIRKSLHFYVTVYLRIFNTGRTTQIAVRLNPQPFVIYRNFPFLQGGPILYAHTRSIQGCNLIPSVCPRYFYPRSQVYLATLIFARLQPGVLGYGVSLFTMPFAS
jgi:hypothetical protein